MSFCSSDGDLRLLDLGLAFLPGIDSAESDQLGGTTRYMAPELFKGAPAGPRSEVFSLGVTLYRLFSGGDFPFGRREVVASGAVASGRSAMVRTRSGAGDRH